MSKIVDLIREVQMDIARLESELIARKQELAEAKRALADDGPVEATNLNRVIGWNSTECAEAVLRAAGKPLHVNQIISSIEREFGHSVKYATLVGNLSRLVQKGKTFERVDPNVFGLLDWSAEREADELFGRQMREESPMQKGEYET